jgi:hypothetical protein
MRGRAGSTSVDDTETAVVGARTRLRRWQREIEGLEHHSGRLAMCIISPIRNGAYVLHQQDIINHSRRGNRRSGGWRRNTIGES